jgi:hypothetical protein
MSNFLRSNLNVFNLDLPFLTSLKNTLPSSQGDKPNLGFAALLVQSLVEYLGKG